MDFSFDRYSIFVMFICFHLATSINRETFQTTAERDAYLYNHSYGCTTLKELRPQELVKHRVHTPKCGCGYYAVRLHDRDHRQDLYNVTTTTLSGRQLRFECKQCDICVGLKVKSVCKPKQNTECSEVCQDPCETYIPELQKCGTDNTKCRAEVASSTSMAVIEHEDTEPTAHPAQRHRPPVTEPTIEPVPLPQDMDYQSWLIVAVVVISASIIAVILMIIVVLCHQNRMHQHSNRSNNSSSNSLLPSASQTSKVKAAPV